MAHQPTDADLIAAAARGDEAAFAALYTRHRDFVARIGLRFCGDHDEALDVVQETFAWLARRLAGPGLRGIGDGRDDTARLTTVLYPVARNTALTLRGRRGRMQIGTAPDTERPAQPAAPHTTNLDAALANLSEPHREVLVLRFIEDMTIPQIAAALAVAEGTVKSRLHHALAAVRAAGHS